MWQEIIVSGAAGLACKLYDNGVDIAGWPDGSWQLEGSKILVVIFTTLFLINNWSATLIFAVYAIICNLQKSADTIFWQAAGIIPAISAVCLAVAGTLPTLADAGLAAVAGALVYIEAALYPEEMSWNKWIGRLAVITGSLGILLIAVKNPDWPVIIPMLAAWTAGYNLLSVLWTKSGPAD